LAQVFDELERSQVSLKPLEYLLRGKPQYGISLRPREESNLRRRLEGFRRVYKIPDRWRQRVDEIGPQLVKRMREFLRGIPITALNPRSLLNELDDLLYWFHQDQGDEPFAFAKMWWLAALINEQVEPAAHSRSRASVSASPLLEEIGSMLQLDRKAKGDGPTDIEQVHEAEKPYTLPSISRQPNRTQGRSDDGIGQRGTFGPFRGHC
jgi:hypothetical protein